ncbi:MAG TPA: hypothetical protein VGL62_15930, partial [Vicinamibacterales bacterium]
MKILHIALERSAAELAARALQPMARNLTLAWTPSPTSALQWLQENADASAIIAQLPPTDSGSFVEQVRERGLTVPVVVVAEPSQLETAVAALNAGADGLLLAGPAIEADFPRVVILAIERERDRRELQSRPLLQLQTERDQLAQVLNHAEEARQVAKLRSASELTEAAGRLADLQAQHTATLAREARICAALQDRLFELEQAQRTARDRSASDAAAFAEQLARRHAEFTTSLAQATHARDAAAAQLSVVTRALEDAREARRADRAAAAHQLRRHEADLTAAQEDAGAARTALEAALADAATTRDARQRAEMALRTANERRAALEGQLAQETERRADLEQTLAAADAGRRHADGQIGTLQARYNAALAEQAEAQVAFERQAADAQSEFERQSAEAASALEQIARDRASDAAEAAERLARREAELVGALAEGTSRETELVAAVAEGAAREAALVERLTRQSDARAAVEHSLDAVRL